MSSDTVNRAQAISALQLRLDAELARRRIGLRFGLENGRAAFEEEVLRLHKAARIGLWRYVVRGNPLLALSAPLIYGLIVPLLLLDACTAIYRAICFQIYGIARVRRADYFVFDRHHLPYLNALEKLNCAYCSYTTGLMGYVREIAARTEAYWCPIKHARHLTAAHEHTLALPISAMPTPIVV
jgi:hypothetical protein